MLANGQGKGYIHFYMVNENKVDSFDIHNRFDFNEMISLFEKRKTIMILDALARSRDDSP